MMLLMNPEQSVGTSIKLRGCLIMFGIALRLCLELVLNIN